MNVFNSEEEYPGSQQLAWSSRLDRLPVIGERSGAFVLEKRKWIPFMLAKRTSNSVVVATMNRYIRSSVGALELFCKIKPVFQNISLGRESIYLYKLSRSPEILINRGFVGMQEGNLIVPLILAQKRYDGSNSRILVRKDILPSKLTALKLIKEHIFSPEYKNIPIILLDDFSSEIQQQFDFPKFKSIEEMNKFGETVKELFLK
jgi:hypothetical protein